MRRALALFLLTLFSLSLIAPILFANTVSTLPACCRRNGKHHCGRADRSAEARIRNEPALKAIQPKCPLFPGSAVAPVSSPIILLRIVQRSTALQRIALATVRPDDYLPRVTCIWPGTKARTPHSPQLDQVRFRCGQVQK